MSPHRRPFLFALALAAAASVAMIGSFWQDETAPSEMPVEAKEDSGARARSAEIEAALAAMPGPGSAGPEGPSAPALAFRAGEIRRYAFSHGQTVRLEHAGTIGGDLEVPAGREEVSIGLQGSLVVTVYGELGDDHLVGYRFEGLAARCDAPRRAVPAEGLSDLGRRLEVEALTRTSALGEMWDVRFRSAIAPGEGNLLKAVLAAFRIVLPSSPADTWTTHEEDLLGLFEATYRIAASEAAGVLEIEKTKTYVELHQIETGASGACAETRGAMRARLSRQAGVVTRLRGEETVVLEDVEVGGRIESASESSFDLVAVETANRAPLAIAFDEFGSLEPSDGFAPDAAAAIAQGEREAAERDRARDLSLEGLLLDLEGAVTGQGVEDLAVLLRRDEESLSRAAGMLESGSLSDEVASALIAALGRAGTPRAQEALLDQVARESSSAHLRGTAILAAVLVESPRSDLVARLRSMIRAPEAADEVTLGLLEGLGIAASKSTVRGDVEGSMAIVRALEDALDDSQDPRWRSAVLLGLGNAGDAHSFDLIARGTSDPDPDVRAAASRALRKMPRQTAYPLLERLALSDPASSVRDAAAHSLEELPQ